MKLVRQYKQNINVHFMKVSFFTGILTFIRMITGFISIKVVSVLIGPAGVALLGQLNNFTSIAMSLATGGIGNGVTKLIAEHAEEKDKTNSIITTALVITVSLSMLIGIFSILFSNYLSNKLFFRSDYSYVLIIFGTTLILYSLNSLISSIVNGFKDFKLYIIIGVFISIIGLVFTVLLVQFWGIKGALIGAVSYQSVVFFISYYLIRKKDWYAKIKSIIFDKQYAKQYMDYALMALTTAILFPLSRFWVRSYIIENIDINNAGIWEGLNRFSGMYLSVITSVLGIYYLPKIAGLNEIKLVKKEVFSGLITTLPLLFVTSVIIYFSRDLIITILFSKDFASMNELFLLQLAGDFLKIASWMFAIIMLSKTMTKIYVISEIITTISYLLFVYVFTPLYGIKGVVFANTLNYVIYLIFAIFLFNSYLKSNKNEKVK